MASNLIKTEPIWSSGTTSSGGYLSKGQRKAIFKQQKISSSAFKSSSAIVSTGKSSGLISSAGSALARRPSISRVRPADIIPLFSGTKTEDGGGSRSIDLNAIAETLIETNRILVEIQRQLAIDFATRMVKERDEFKRIRLGVDRDRKQRKEDKIEAGKLGFAGKVFDKALSPIKGLWSRLLGFFGWISAGWLTNKAVNWLVKNPAAIGKFFDTVTKNWKLIAAIAGGLVLASIVGKLWGAWRIAKLILGIAAIGGASNRIRGGIPSIPKKGSKGNWIRRLNPFARGKPRQLELNLGKQFTKKASKQITKQTLQGAFKGVAKGTLRGVATKMPILGGIFETGFSLAEGRGLGESLARGGGSMAGLLSGVALTSWIPIPGARIVGGLIGATLGPEAVSTLFFNKAGNINSKDKDVNNWEKLSPPESSNSTTILPEFNAGMADAAGRAVNVPAVGGDSIPFVEAVDPYNEWIPRSKNLLGLAV